MARKKKSMNSGIGGQAVLEGIMMKCKEDYAIAVRKPDGEIDIEIHEYHSVMHGSAVTKIPFVRGVFNFIDSLVLGTRAINHSASFYEDEDAKESWIDKKFGAKAEKVASAITVILSLVLAIGLFIILPYYLSSIVERYVMNDSLLRLIEGGIRIVIFLLYVVAITLMKDIRRLYMYHGAEHKCINCIENGHRLTVNNVKRSSRLHRRCGTSFVLIVMLISVILFIFIKVESPAMRVLIRILLIPVIAGISYEIIRFCGSHDNILVKIIAAPGLLLQRLTTKEPDEAMIEVAIQSVEAVFDWRSWLEENFANDRRYRTSEEESYDEDLE